MHLNGILQGTELSTLIQNTMLPTDQKKKSYVDVLARQKVDCSAACMVRQEWKMYQRGEEEQFWTAFVKSELSKNPITDSI